MKAFLNSFVKLWQQLGVNQRVSLVMAVLTVIGVLGALLTWTQRPDYQLLYGRLNEKDSSAVITQLEALKTPHKIEQGGSAIYVPSDQIYKVRAALAQKGIPSGDGVGLEIFDRSNFGVSDFVQRTNFIRAMQGELTRTITQMEGVRAARVLIVQPENRLLVLNNPTAPSASVFVDTGGQRLSLESVNAIRHLVSSAIQGLSQNNVSIVDNKGRVLTAELDEDPSLSGATAQIRYRKSLEDYLTKKVESMLDSVTGPGNSVVRVSVEVDPETVTRNQEIYDPAGQVVRSLSNIEDSSISSEAKSGGAVGTTGNIPGESGVATTTSGDGPKSEQTRKNRTTQYEINTTRLNVTKSAGSIKQVTAAVFLNQKREGTGTDMKPMPRTAEEMDGIRQLVMNALGLQAEPGKNLESMVAVKEMAFPATPVDLLVPDSVVTKPPSVYLDYGMKVLPLLGGAIVLMIFVRSLRKQSPEVIPVEILTDYKNATKVVTPAKEITPELINTMIREKPDAVGASLREWVGTEGGSVIKE